MDCKIGNVYINDSLSQDNSTLILDALNKYSFNNEWQNMYSMHTVSFSEDFKVLLNLTDNSAASADIDNSLS